MTKKVKSVEEEALAKLDPFAEGLKKTVEQLWGIFVRRYIAKGVAELFGAGVIAWLTYVKLWQDHWVYWLCIPFPAIMVLAIDAIQLLINPHYYAMNDVAATIKRQQKPAVEEVYSSSRYR